jgi:hypothetical protein
MPAMITDHRLRERNSRVLGGHIAPISILEPLRFTADIP